MLSDGLYILIGMFVSLIFGRDDHAYYSRWQIDVDGLRKYRKLVKVKSFPSHMGPWGGADLRFL